MDNNENLKPVTFELPSRLANLIEETRNHLPGQWEEWLAVPAKQSLEHDAFDDCRREFEGLFVDSQWKFDDSADRAKFVAPLHRALQKAYESS